MQNIPADASKNQHATLEVCTEIPPHHLTNTGHVISDFLKAVKQTVSQVVVGRYYKVGAVVFQFYADHKGEISMRHYRPCSKLQDTLYRERSIASNGKRRPSTRLVYLNLKSQLDHPAN